MGNTHIHGERAIYFPYVQFSAVTTKGADVFPLVRQAIKCLTCLGLIVTAITCDGASDNSRMFQMFNSKDGSTERKEVFFITDPLENIKWLKITKPQYHIPITFPL